LAGDFEEMGLEDYRGGGAGRFWEVCEVEVAFGGYLLPEGDIGNNDRQQVVG